MAARPCLLLTRPEVDSAPLAETLKAKGIDSLIEPMLTVVVTDGLPLDLSGVQAVLFTSANGVRAFTTRQDNGTKVQGLDVPACCVGDATARAASAAGFVSVESAGGDVDDLARLAKARYDPEQGVLLHAAASKLAGDLKGLLEEAGFTYRREVLYETQSAAGLSPACREALEADDLKGVLLYSPRTAATFASVLAAEGLDDHAAALDCFCLSENVARAAGNLTWRDVVTARAPTQEALLAEVFARFSR